MNIWFLERLSIVNVVILGEIISPGADDPGSNPGPGDTFSFKLTINI